MNVRGNFKNKANTVKFRVPVISFNENDVYFYYSPVLDLTGYGNTDDEAKTSFQITIGQFFDYTTNKKTLQTELKRLGWKIAKKKVTKAPSLLDMIHNNEYLAEIFEEKQYKKFHASIDIPALV